MAALDLEFCIDKNLKGNCLDVMIHFSKGKFPAVASPLLMTSITPELEGSVQPPTFSLTKEAAQGLLDELWSVGVRPSNGAGNVGELAATKYHLEDMRQIVAALMELKK